MICAARHMLSSKAIQPLLTANRQRVLPLLSRPLSTWTDRPNGCGCSATADSTPYAAGPTTQTWASPVRERMLAQLDERKPKYGLASEFYTDPGYFEAEMESIWYKEWVFVGHDVDVKNPGEYFTFNLGSYPIVVVRGKDNVIRAFHNVCRHRGYKLAQEESGRVRRRFKCGYHNWTYELDGRLAFASDCDSDFDMDAHSLKPVHIQSAGGYLYVNVDEKPKDFSAAAQVMEEYAAPYDLRKAKVAFESKIVEKGNWKLVWENNRECFHCKFHHPELTIVFPDSTWWNGGHATPEEAKILKDTQDLCEGMGLPSKYVAADDMQWRAHRIPFVKARRSFSMDGEPVVKTMRMGSFPMEGSYGDVIYYNYPSTWNHWVADHCISFRMLPISPTETELTTKWLVPEDAVEGVDYDVEKLKEVWVNTNDQDRRIIETNQVGVRSPAFEPGMYSSSQEEGVIQFVNWYSTAMKNALRGSESQDAASMFNPSDVAEAVLAQHQRMSSLSQNA